MDIPSCGDGRVAERPALVFTRGRFTWQPRWRRERSIEYLAGGRGVAARRRPKEDFGAGLYASESTNVRTATLSPATSGGRPATVTRHNAPPRGARALDWPTTKRPARYDTVTFPPSTRAEQAGSMRSAAARADAAAAAVAFSYLRAPDLGRTSTVSAESCGVGRWASSSVLKYVVAKSGPTECWCYSLKVRSSKIRTNGMLVLFS